MIKIIPLKCPNCNSELSGFNRDVIFFCTSCRKAYWLENEKKEFKFSYASQLIEKPPKSEKFFLPFYSFRADWDVKGNRVLLLNEQPDPFYSSQAGRDVKGSQKQKKTIEKIAKEYQNIWVAGFNILRASYYGEIGLLFTEKKPEITEDPEYGGEERKRLGGCSRTIEQAQVYLNLYPLQILDKKIDISGLNVKISPTDFSIWAIPFFILNDKIIDAILGREYPAFSLDFIEEMKAKF